VSLAERLTYRADFFLSTILRFLPMVTTILLWHAVYAGMDENGEGWIVRMIGFDEPRPKRSHPSRATTFTT